ncbi:MAG: hypothetical protein JJD98_12100 [Polaromonas sp.]|nr:hypothetical protein [Polaromonas sp.]
MPTGEAIVKAARISSNTISQIESIQKSAMPELADGLIAMFKQTSRSAAQRIRRSKRSWLN